MSVKVLHLADLHLDTPFKSLMQVSYELSDRIQNATKQSFSSLVNIALEQAVDIVIIAGDAFNSAKPSVSAQLFLKEQLERLIAQNIEVVMCFGNHDYYKGALLVSLPEKVHVFDQHVTTFDIITKQQQKVCLSGFSYHTNHIETVEWSQFPHKKGEEFIHIGVLHGQMEDKGVYAPFSIKQLDTFGYDYWALGHIHKRQIIAQQPLVAYSGSIQGLHINETQAKGGYLITFHDNHQADIAPVDTAPIIWEQCEVSIENTMTLEDVLNVMKRQMNTLESKTNLYFIRFILNYNASIDTELLDALQTFEWSKDFYYSPTHHIIDVKLKATQEMKALLMDDDMQVLWNNLQQDPTAYEMVNENAKTLWQHRLVQNYFGDVIKDKTFLMSIFDKSTQLLEQAIGGEEDVH